MSEDFPGFPTETFEFLRGLKANNSKAWFDDHRKHYDDYFVAPALDFIAAISDRAAGLKPPHKAVAKMNGSLRRLNRDLRFSKDKTPYQTHMHLIFWTGDHPNRSAGIHLVLNPDRFGCGAGHWAFETAALERYRQAVADGRRRRTLETALEATRAAGCELDPPALKRVPAGYDADAPFADWLRYKGLVTRTQTDAALPKQLKTPACLDYCGGLFDALAPLNGWIAKHVEEA